MGKYIAAIRGKVRGNIVMPPDVKGNPEAVFEVTQLPSGDVLNVRLLKSSGHTAYDSATERAIRKSSPLPKPAKGELFSRTLELKFRPQDE
jgi:colicin import membrane protein